MSIVDIARPEIRSLVPYSSARMEAGENGVMLNANEFPWPTAGTKFNRYPEPQPRALINAMASLYGVDAECVLVGRGSDEAIDLLVRAFCKAGRDAVAICSPTFGMYAVCAQVQDAKVVDVPLTSRFELDEAALLRAVTPATKIIFLCSPNNPTGNAISIDAIERIASALVGRTLVVVDEAYIEFSESVSATTLLGSYNNIAVLRTLSKAYALAGTRVGCLLASPDVIALLRRIQAPYPLPSPCVDLALAALEMTARSRTLALIECIKRERERVSSELASLPDVQVLPSVANFVCAQFPDGDAIYRSLLSQGVVVRNAGKYPGLSDFLRITIGTAKENDQMLDALARRCEAA